MAYELQLDIAGVGTGGSIEGDGEYEHTVSVRSDGVINPVCEVEYNLDIRIRATGTSLVNSYILPGVKIEGVGLVGVLGVGSYEYGELEVVGEGLTAILGAGDYIVPAPVYSGSGLLTDAGDYELVYEIEASGSVISLVTGTGNYSYGVSVIYGVGTSKVDTVLSYNRPDSSRGTEKVTKGTPLEYNRG